MTSFSSSSSSVCGKEGGGGGEGEELDRKESGSSNSSSDDGDDDGSESNYLYFRLRPNLRLHLRSKPSHTATPSGGIIGGKEQETHISFPFERNYY